MSKLIKQEGKELLQACLNPQAQLREDQTFRLPDFSFKSTIDSQEEGAYRLFWSRKNSFSNKIAILVDLLGLDGIILKTEVQEDEDLGYFYLDQGEKTYISEFYLATDPTYRANCSLPILVDNQSGLILSNDYQHISYQLADHYRLVTRRHSLALVPEDRREDVVWMNDWLEENVVQSMMKALFTENLIEFTESYEAYFNALEQLDASLAYSRFLLGDQILDCDLTLFVALIRLDVYYSRYIAPSKKRLVDFENLWPYARDVYRVPEVRKNIYFKDFAAGKNVEEESEAYWYNTYYDIVLPSMDLDSIWLRPTGREALSANPSHKFVYYS